MTSSVRLNATRPLDQHSACPRELDPHPTGPVRTCVGCRTRDLRSDLLRLVLAPSDGGHQLAVDVRGNLPGRGAWIHPDPACVELAARRRAVSRALRATASLDLTGLRAYLEQQDR